MQNDPKAPVPPEPAPSDQTEDPYLQQQREAAKKESYRKAEAARRRQDAIDEVRDEHLRKGNRWGTPGEWSPLLLLAFIGDNTVIWLLLGLLTISISAIVALFQLLRWPMFYFIRSLDVATGAASIPAAPWIMWAIWGGLFGGSLGYWLIAPVYGGRENRGLLPLLPLLLMLLISAILWAFVR